VSPLRLKIISTFISVRKITIAIDGYSSCGKSTLAKALAHKLGYNYVDTGAMYRAVTHFALEHHLINDDGDIQTDYLINALPLIDIHFEVNPHTHQSEVFLNNENIERQIRGMEVSSRVSKISTIKEVRDYLVTLQRALGKRKGLVMDGRDIGSHVFPNAEIKLFMTADAEVRARRRYDEYHSKGQFLSMEEVKKNLEQRDHDDLHRKESPLIQAKDAIVLDNSELTREEQLDFVLKLIDRLRVAFV